MSNSEASVAKTNVLAFVSLVTSILGLGILGYGIIFGIAGVITGHIGLAQIKKKGQSGRGVAIAGLVVGYVAVVFQSTLIFVTWFIFTVGLQRG